MNRFLVGFILIGNWALADVGMVADVSLNPAGSFKAKSSDVKGEAILNADGSVKAENIIINLKNIKTGLELRDKHTTEKYLEVAKYPEAVLVSATGKGGQGKGRIKLRGIEKDVVGTYQVEGKELTAEFAIKLSDYGITGVKYMGIGVNDEIKIHFTIPIVKK